MGDGAMHDLATHEPDPPAADCTDGHTRLPATVNGWVGCEFCDWAIHVSEQRELSCADLENL
jgi:hypothetical protein